MFKKNFSERCYMVLGKVPAGRVTTYGEIARALGSNGFLAVGMAMNKNPYAPKVACHQVVVAGVRLVDLPPVLPKKLRC